MGRKRKVFCVFFSICIRYSSFSEKPGKRPGILKRAGRTSGLCRARTPGRDPPRPAPSFSSFFKETGFLKTSHSSRPRPSCLPACGPYCSLFSPFRQPSPFPGPLSFGKKQGSPHKKRPEGEISPSGSLSISHKNAGIFPRQAGHSDGKPFCLVTEVFHPPPGLLSAQMQKNDPGQHRLQARFARQRRRQMSLPPVGVPPKGFCLS